MISGPEALARLREGNGRFVSSMAGSGPTVDQTRARVLARAQQPFAIVLGCSDSRVPAELVFGQGFGDLFVIRVAGNIVAPSQVGSVEFAAARFGTRLAVVLGHTHCGAIEATLEELRQPSSQQSPNLRSIVGRIRPSVEPLLASPLQDRPQELAARAVRANILAGTNHLRQDSEILQGLIAHEGFVIVGAEYCLETGVVEFFDGVAGTV
jgi:carbonic anhydrase